MIGEAGLTLFLCGDVMTGRGVDQVLPNPGDPRIHEPGAETAELYVRLAESANGPIPRPVDFSYIWGDALEELAKVGPSARVVNLETSVTRSDDYWKGKGINYRMHPANVPCITAARIDCCVLANNHTLDYGYSGLLENLSDTTLDRIRETIQLVKRPHDIVVASIHWGGNWGMPCRESMCDSHTGSSVRAPMSSTVTLRTTFARSKYSMKS